MAKYYPWNHPANFSAFLDLQFPVPEYRFSVAVYGIPLPIVSVHPPAGQLCHVPDERRLSFCLWIAVHPSDDYPKEIKRAINQQQQVLFVSLAQVVVPVELEEEV